MSEFEKGLIVDFLSERWALFVAFCAERGIDAQQAEDIFKCLEFDR